MDNIRRYLQETVGLTVNMEKLPDTLLRKLPMYLIYGYDYYLLEHEGNLTVLADCGNDMSKTAEQLKKQSKTISQQLGMPVVFAMDSQSVQLRRRMVSEKTGFIVPGSQVYLPHLWINLTENVQPSQSYSERLSPSAQLLLLYHLQVEHLDVFPLKEIAVKLDYTPKTITKIAAELKSKKLCKISGTKEKRLAFDVDRKQLWTTAEPQMQSPVGKSFFTDQKGTTDFCKSGDSALSYYTFLADTGKEAYAVYKTDFEKQKESGYWDYLDETEGNTRIDVWKYNPRILSDNGYIDPLSLYLCYREDRNERVAAEINKLIEKRTW
ncbi:MAG: hypothetical protein LBR10_04935 [Prevotellaceae bacterium]|jgi:hypothetical protein|nr:hypothetical protein [Prevotellaceae bacterium]